MEWVVKDVPGRLSFEVETKGAGLIKRRLRIVRQWQRA